jgi:Mitochondrial carrier protein
MNPSFPFHTFSRFVGFQQNNHHPLSQMTQYQDEQSERNQLRTSTHNTIVATSSSSSSISPSSTPSKTVVFVTSGLGGVLGWAMIHPFNTIAVRMNLAPKGEIFSISNMIKQNGFLSLYAGLEAGMLRQVFYATSRFGLFETFRDILHDYRGKTDFASRVGVGAITGTYI